MDVVEATLTGVLEKKLTEAQLTKFLGKVCVCIQEAVCEVRAVTVAAVVVAVAGVDLLAVVLNAPNLTCAALRSSACPGPGQGTLLHSDAETILQMSKLKPPTLKV